MQIEMPNLELEFFEISGKKFLVEIIFSPVGLTQSVPSGLGQQILSVQQPPSMTPAQAEVDQTALSIKMKAEQLTKKSTRRKDSKQFAVFCE